MPKINIKKVDIDEQLKTLQKNLISLMTKYKVDYLELSRLTGVGSTTISRFRTCTGNPNLKTLVALAQFFGVTVAEFIGSDLSE